MRSHLRAWQLGIGALLFAACGSPESVELEELLQSVVIDPTAAYTIAAVASNKCVQIEGESANHGAVLEIHTCNGSRAQQFHVRPVNGGTGHFNLVNVKSGLGVDVEGASRADGARVLQWPTHNRQNQQWSITDVSSGVVRLTARHSGKVMEVSAGATVDGSDLRQRTWSSTPNQQFRLNIAGSDNGDGESGDGEGGDNVGGDAARSAGCGKPTSLASGNHTIDVNGTRRTYILDIPRNYDSNRAYRLAFAWHARGTDAAELVRWSNYYGMKALAKDSAILVAPNGIDKSWANNGGRDEAFARAMVKHFQENLCIDSTRIFAAGYSFGGMMSNVIGCNMADVFRAIAPMSGALFSGCNRANAQPIAVWMAHGTRDDVVPFARGKEALDHFLRKNGCSAETSPISPSPCVAYQGCKAGYPVTFCAYDGDHEWPAFLFPSIWPFFSQF